MNEQLQARLDAIRPFMVEHMEEIIYLMNSCTVGLKDQRTADTEYKTIVNAAKADAQIELINRVIASLSQ